jgi:transcriptional regulator with XRE-family HTH domain
MPGSEEQAAIGRRMKAAAVQAGMNAYQIADQMGVKPTTIYRWWYGERAPSTALLTDYAGLVGKPVGYFYEYEGEEAEPREVASVLLCWADLLMAGEEPGAAFDRVTGEPGELTPRERQKLATAANRMREDLIQAAGGDWALLTEEQRRQILHQIAALADERRAELANNPQ